MGHQVAQSFADAERDGLCSLEAAIHYHLRANHYPPPPQAMVAVAMAAIRELRDGGDGPVALPEGVEHRVYGRKVPASVIAEAFHLWPWLENDDEDDDEEE
jgi:hypothetical protein